MKQTNIHCTCPTPFIFSCTYCCRSMLFLSLENCRVDVCSYDFILMFKTFYQTVPTCTNVTCTSARQTNDRREHTRLSKDTENVIFETIRCNSYIVLLYSST